MHVAFPYLEHLELYLLDPSALRNGSGEDILRANPQLPSLTIWFDGALTLSTILDVIQANTLITELKVEKHEFGTIRARDELIVTVDELNRFVAEHPLVEKLILKDHRLKTADAINFVRQMKPLKRFGFLTTSRRDDYPGIYGVWKEWHNKRNNECELGNSIIIPSMYVELAR